MISRITHTDLPPLEKPAPRKPSHRSLIKRQLGERWLAKYDEAEGLMKEARQLMVTGEDAEKVSSAGESATALYAQVMAALRELG